MARSSRICSVLECDRTHHGKGFCRIHYGEFIQKPQKQAASAKQATEPPTTANGEEPESR